MEDLQLIGRLRMADYYRTVNDVIFDILWPGGGLQPHLILDSGSQRHNAIIEVLRRIPELEYKNLLDFADDFYWFIPPPRLGGFILPAPATYTPELSTGQKLIPHSKVLYLSPALEKSAWDIVVATVAHELTNIALQHKTFHSPEVDETLEKEAFERMISWGFEIETKKLKKVNKWYGTYEKSLNLPKRTEMT